MGAPCSAGVGDVDTWRAGVGDGSGGGVWRRRRREGGERDVVVGFSYFAFLGPGHVVRVYIVYGVEGGLTAEAPWSCATKIPMLGVYSVDLEELWSYVYRREDIPAMWTTLLNTEG